MAPLRDLILASHTEDVEIRHDLHRHPELGYEEVRTSETIQRHLASFGIAFRAGLAGGTGVLGYLPATGGNPEKTVALRADMDALPISEQTGLDYASRTQGVMHACGHDGHVTMLLAAARALSRTPDRRNDVLFLFQPAEEGGAGGKRMVEDGTLRGEVLGGPANVIYGLHGNPFMTLDQVSTRVGPMMAAATEFRITVRGKGTHAAYPHFGIDPILVSAHIITALQSVASRNTDPLDSVVVTVGKIDAGVAHNVIPQEAVMRGTLRALNDATDAAAKRRVDELVQGVATAFGASAEIEWTGGYPVVVNHPEATEQFRTVAREVLGADRVEEELHPSMGGEDFSFYGREIPACFFFLGLNPSHQDSYPNLHAPNFDFNDDALSTGALALASLALKG